MSEYYCLQNCFFAENDIENKDLYYRSNGSIKPAKELCLKANDVISFDTYYNSFSCGKWKYYTDIKQIILSIRAVGRFEVLLCHSYMEEDTCVQKCISKNVYTFESQQVNKLKIVIPSTGIIYPVIRCLSKDGNIMKLAYETMHLPCILPKLAFNICTFHREKEVRSNIEKLKNQCMHNRESALYGNMEIFLVDNGQSLSEIYQSDNNVQYFSNKNIGGTGGFTRGLVEILDRTRQQSITHVVFMDDDAEVITLAMERLWSFLAYLKPEYREHTVCGGLMRRELPYIQAETGARWDRGKIQSHHANLDMSIAENVVRNELEDNQIDYSGWWFSCVPIETIRKIGLPLPLFLHRDDVEYGLRMKNKFITLNGISIRHETYDTKLSQATEYYDIRNYAIVEAIHNPHFSKQNLLKTVRKWILGNLLRFRYKYVFLNLKGVHDFLNGARWLREQDVTELHQSLSKWSYPLVKEQSVEKYWCFDSIANKKDVSLSNRLRLIASLFVSTGNTVKQLAPWQSVYDYADAKKVVVRDLYGSTFCVEKDLKRARQLMRWCWKVLRFDKNRFEQAKNSYVMEYNQLIDKDQWKNRWANE